MFASQGWVVIGNALRCSFSPPAKQGRPSLASLGISGVQPPGNFYSPPACSMFLHMFMAWASLFDSLRLFGSHRAQHWLFLALFQSLVINFTLQWDPLVTRQGRRERKPQRLTSQDSILPCSLITTCPLLHAPLALSLAEEVGFIPWTARGRLWRISQRRQKYRALWGEGSSWNPKTKEEQGGGSWEKG